MIKFLFILSIFWGIISVLGWINLVNQLRKARFQFQIDRIINGFRLWTLVADLVCIAFWIWLVVR